MVRNSISRPVKKISRSDLTGVKRVDSALCELCDTRSHREPISHSSLWGEACLLTLLTLAGPKHGPPLRIIKQKGLLRSGHEEVLHTQISVSMV